jgi:phosphate transport system substrate-binding protein
VPVAALSALALALTACGNDDDSSDDEGGSAESSLSGTLNGAGASSQQAGMAAWIAGFQTANPDVTVNYDPVGSGGGREQFISGGVDFAGSDAYLDDEELAAASDRCGAGEALDLANYIAPIAVAFNLEGIDTLNLTHDTVAQIFDGQITNWSDDAIAATNEGVELPDLRITPVHRADDSGTTDNFTEYLAETAPDSWPYDPDGVWPTSGGEAAQGTSGVVQAINSGNGAIGYIDASQVGDLGTAAVGDGSGEFSPYSAEASAEAVSASPLVEGRPELDGAIELDRAAGYPIVLVSYHIVCTTYETQAEVDLVTSFMEYIISEEGQAQAEANAGNAPINDTLRERSQAAIDAITVG